MTTWTLTCYDGRTYPLPTPLAWRLEYGVGDPCDSFWVKTLEVGGGGGHPGRASPASR